MTLVNVIELDSAGRLKGFGPLSHPVPVAWPSEPVAGPPDLSAASLKPSTSAAMMQHAVHLPAAACMGETSKRIDAGLRFLSVHIVRSIRRASLSLPIPPGTR